MFERTWRFKSSHPHQQSCCFVRRQVLALVMMPARAWLTSCAIDAVSSPIVITRAICARSACVLRSSCCVCFQSRMSTIVPCHSKIRPCWSSNGSEPVMHHRCVRSAAWKLRTSSRYGTPVDAGHPHCRERHREQCSVASRVVVSAFQRSLKIHRRIYGNDKSRSSTNEGGASS